MNKKEAEAFFDKLEEGLKEDFKIPKLKSEDSRSNDKELGKEQEKHHDKDQDKETGKKLGKIGNNDDTRVDSKDEDNDTGKDDGKDYDDKTSNIQAYKGDQGPLEAEPVAKRPRRNDPLGLEIMTFGEAQEAGLAGDPGGLLAWQSLYNGPLPPELIAMCHISQCDLCHISLTSPIVSKSHYLGKSHSKKTAAFLAGRSFNSGPNQVPQRVKTQDPVEEDDTFCKICNIALSSKIVAVAHYAGKKHASKVRNTSRINPLPQGPVDPTGGFGIGMAFHKPKENAEERAKLKEGPEEEDKPQENLEEGEVNDDWTPASEMSSNPDSRRYFCLPCKMYFGLCEEYAAHIVSSEHKAKAFSQMGSEDTRQFYCSICMVQCSDQPTYDTHLKDPMHKAKVTADSETSLDRFMSQIKADPMSIYFCKTCNLQCTGKSDYEAHVNGRKHKSKSISVSIAGAFRCDICQVTTTDENGLNMHFQGKKHKKKAATAS